ncbi:MAG: DUF4982 domain-containing protein, partial [Faecalibacterium sp.]|nr:DUF4982 domain-containing protein [Faecalibacterium sp.]
GGEPGMNHKGLVTFDRKTKKDSFYLYKAWWSSDRFVHICSKRFVDRCGKKTTIKVYSTDDTVTLMVNGKTVGKKTSSDHVFTFTVPLDGDLDVEAFSGLKKDTAHFHKVDKPNPAYKLVKNKNAQKSNWVDN